MSGKKRRPYPGRRIEGKVYKYYGSYPTKGLAEDAAVSLRMTHWLARIVHRKKGPLAPRGPWEVYARNGKK